MAASSPVMVAGSIVSDSRQSAPNEDWYLIICRLMEGDQLALARIGRLLNGFLARWSAYDLRDEWDDLIQEVVMAAVVAVRDGQLRDRAAVIGWLRTTARFKFVDRLRSHLRCPKHESLPTGTENCDLDAASETFDLDLREDLRRALDRLPARARAAVLGVYLHGKTYDEAAQESGVPLGSLKRCLRDGLEALRTDLASA